MRTKPPFTRQLERWLDFKSYQVFEEATTYTALQFYTKGPNDAVKVAFSPGGPPPERPWADPDCALPYEKLAFGERWLLLTGKERALIDKLYATCTRLDDSDNTKGIFVGIQTSADHIYHLRRLGPDRYVCTPKGDHAPPPYEVELEDALMKPVVSGPDAKRYIEPKTDTFLLFPYRQTEEDIELIPAADLENEYPDVWAYLRSYEKELRARESEKMDIDDGWWAYNYPKNLDKQEIDKLIVAQTVPSLRVCYDANGTQYLNNVRVNGISTPDAETAWFLLAVLNGSVADFVFRRIAKPKDGGWFEANKQFIAPLPIPYATTEERADAAARAERLQALHTKRRDVLENIARRLGSALVKRRPDSFLFPDLAPAKARLADAPKALEPEVQRAWAKARYEEALQARYATIGERLRPGSVLDATFAQGELKFLGDGVAVIDRIFLSDADGEFIAAQWKVVASTLAVPEKKAGEKLCNELRKLIDTDNAALREQVIALQAQLSETEASIATEEAVMNAALYRLYALSKAEIALVEKDRAA